MRRFYFPWSLNVGNYSSWLVISRLFVNCGGLKLVTDIRDHHSILHNFETRVLRMVGSTIDSDFTCRYAICIMEPSRFCFLQTLSCVRKVIQKSISIAYFRDSGKGNFYIHDHLFFHLWTVPLDNPLFKTSILLAYFCDSGKQNFYISDPWFFSSMNRTIDTSPQPPSLHNLQERENVDPCHACIINFD